MLLATAPSYWVMERIILTGLCSYNSSGSVVETKIQYGGFYFYVLSLFLEFFSFLIQLPVAVR